MTTLFTIFIEKAFLVEHIEQIHQKIHILASSYEPKGPQGKKRPYPLRSILFDGFEQIRHFGLSRAWNTLTVGLISAKALTHYPRSIMKITACLLVVLAVPCHTFQFMSKWKMPTHDPNRELIEEKFGNKSKSK